MLPDPDNALDELRRLVADSSSIMDGTSAGVDELEHVDELVALVRRLDQHLSAGGSPPRAWSRDRAGHDAGGTA